MFTFSHESTNQTDALTDYRYIGNEPNNYIYFNCTDGNDTSTCEKWRIIGVFEVEDENGNKEQRVKIIREYLYSSMSWTSSSNSNNNWVTSKINENLNSGDFYNSLTDGAKELIGKSKYYLASGVYDTTTHYGSGDDIYNWERSNQVNGSNPKYWIGDIGLMYPSDYTYTFAKGVNDYCFNDIYNCRNYNPTYSWIYNTNRYSASGSISDLWLITSNSQDSMYSFIIYSSGYVIGSYYILTSHQIRPVLYLSSSVQYVDGDGSIDNPYVISK